MMFSCTRDNLHQALSITSHLTHKAGNLPILQNVLIRSEGGVISFTATNLETVVQCSTRGKVDANGELTVPSKLFYDYVNLLPEGTVTLKKVGESLTVEAGSHKTKIHGLPAGDFPLVPTVNSKEMYQIPVDDLRKNMGRVLFAAAQNESRPELTGLLLQFRPWNQEGQLTMAATDSYRLSEATTPVTSPVLLPAGEEALKVIVPSRALAELARILAVFRDEVDSPSHVLAQWSDGQIVFQYGSVQLISRVIEGRYPDYRQIIPKQFATRAVLDREDLMKAVKTASLFSRSGLFDVTLRVEPADGRVSVTSLEATRGENTTSCFGIVQGKENSVTVNFRYLLDGLNAMESDRIVFEMNDASNPCLLTPETSSSSLYIIMPIKA